MGLLDDIKHRLQAEAKGALVSGNNRRMVGDVDKFLGLKPGGKVLPFSTPFNIYDDTVRAKERAMTPGAMSPDEMRARQMAGAEGRSQDWQKYLGAARQQIEEEEAEAQRTNSGNAANSSVRARIDAMLKELEKPITLDDAYAQAQMNNSRASVERAMRDRGIQGGLSNLNTQKAITDTGTMLSEGRKQFNTNQIGSLSQLLLSDDASRRNAEAQMNQMKEMQRQFNVKIDLGQQAERRAQELAQRQGIFGLGGAVLGGTVGGLAGGPQGILPGAQAGTQFGGAFGSLTAPSARSSLYDRGSGGVTY